jgi:hypothetical protein
MGKKKKKKFVRPPSEWKKAEHDGCICHPVTMGSINRKIVVQAGLGKKARPYI